MKLTNSVYLILLMNNIVFSQFVISGKINNENKQLISRAIVQVLAIDSTVTNFTFSNNEGFYKLPSVKKGEFLLKVSALNYIPQYRSIKLESDFVEDFVLFKKDIELKEIIIIAQQKAAKISKDSISYNINVIRDSTETNLGDLIRKLPGLEISAEGKVKFQGITIDKILIDGNDFFGNKHQMATENIGANMVEGIDLLLKHNDNINLKEFGENSKIALNIKLNSKSKNLILGNIEASGGVASKYSTHSNTFKFLKNGNLSFISDFNNIGDMPLTVPDYFDIIGGAESISTQSIGLTDVSEMIPDYIYNEDKRKERQNLFSAFNLAIKTTTFKINSNIFFNNFKQLEQRLNNRLFLDKTIPQINESYINKSNFLLFNANFRMQFAINNKSNIKLLFNIVPSNGNSSENIINSYNYDTKSNKENLVINNQINYQYKINEKFLLSSELTYKIDKISNNFNIYSDDSNLYNLNSNTFSQDYFYKNNRLNSINSLLFKSNKNKYKYSFSFDYNIENLDTNILDTNFENKLERDIKNLIYKIDITQYINDKVFFKYQFTSNSYFINSKLKKFIDNNISLNYNLNAASNFSLGYQNNNKILELVSQLDNNYILNYQSINVPNNITDNPFINKKTFSFAFNNYKSKTEQFFTLNLSYSFADQNDTNNTLYVNNYSLFSNLFGVGYKNYMGILNFDTKITSLPLLIKSSLSFDYSNNVNFINSLKNNSELLKNALSANLTSSFKKITTQLQLSYLAEYVNINQSLFSTKYNLLTQNIGFKIISKINSFKIEPSFNYLMQNGSLNSNYQTLLGLNINYTDKQNKLSYFIISSNLLNINRFEQITQTSNNFVIENSIYSMIPGYTMFGIKYNY
ncbi:TonB-dependent receptor [Lutibacter sp.]|uniref:TonB-dependent receptor n=1 Tax=Lutibacter sp. TaxID=1925666 RepID=UPI003565D154